MTMNLTPEQYLILGAFSLTLVILSALITWAISSSKIEQKLSEINIEKGSEHRKVEDIKLQLASTQQELELSRESVVTAKIKISELQKGTLGSSDSGQQHQSLVDQMQQISSKLAGISVDPLRQPILKPIADNEDFAEIPTHEEMEGKSALTKSFEGFTSDSEGSGI